MFKRILVVIIAGSLIPTLAAQQPTQRKHRIKVRKGIYLKLETVQPLSSATAEVGDPLPLRLARPLVVDDAVLLPEGMTFQATVSKVKRAGPNCQYGAFELKMDHIQFADGTLAKSKVDLWSSGPYAYVPEYLPYQSAGGWDDVKSNLAVVPLLPVVLFVAAIHPHEGGNSHGGAPIQCTAPGKEYEWPAGTTVAVWITKDHHVRVMR